MARTDFSRAAMAAASLLLLVACSPAAPAAPTQSPAGGQATPQPAGNTTSMSLEQLALYDGADRQALLEEGARKEGKVIWYSSSIKDTIGQPIIDAFVKKYPYLQPEFFRADGDQLKQRLDEEIGAHRYVADVLETTMGEYQEILAEQYLLPYYSPSLKAIPDNAKDKNGYWAVTREIYPGIAFNTNVITSSQAPKTYEDLLDSKWKGKMSFPSGTYIVQMVGVIMQTRGEDYLKNLSAQDPLYREISPSALSNLVASGEAPLSIMVLSKDIELLKRKGAPVDWLPLNPIPPQRAAIGLMKNAPHPYAALLLLDFILSPEGQGIYRSQAYGLPGQGEGTAYQLLDIAATKDYAASYAQWEKLMLKYIAKTG